MLKSKRAIPFVPYAVALGAVALATVISVNWPTLRQIHSFWVYMLAVYLTAWFGGMWPSIVSILCSSLSWAYFIAPPEGLAVGEWGDKVRLMTFIIIALLFSFLYSARSNAEKKVRSMMQRLRLALEGTKVGVWDLNLETGAIWHSASMEEIFGRRGERFSSAYEVFVGYVHPEDRDFVHRTVTHSIERGDEFYIQYRILLPEGEMRWVSTRGRVFFDSKGRAERLVAATEDLTNCPGAALTPAAKLGPLPPMARIEAVPARAG